jgi:hypothetical protein
VLGNHRQTTQQSGFCKAICVAAARPAFLHREARPKVFFASFFFRKKKSLA